MRLNNFGLLTEIQKKREKMIESAKVKGINDEATVRYSQELDRLIFEYQCQFHSQQTQRFGQEVKAILKKMIMIILVVFYSTLDRLDFFQSF